MKTKQNETKQNDGIEDQAATPMSRRTLLKTTMAASAVSLGILGATQTPGKAKTEARPQESRDNLALSEYFKDFNYCDAKVLAGYWGGSEYEAKIRMGYTLLNKKPEQAKRYIREARGLALDNSSVISEEGFGILAFPIDYGDGGYEYDDAVALSEYWKKELLDTKILMETMLVSGKDNYIKAALNKAKR